MKTILNNIFLFGAYQGGFDQASVEVKRASVHLEVFDEAFDLPRRDQVRFLLLLLLLLLFPMLFLLLFLLPLLSLLLLRV